MNRQLPIALLIYLLPVTLASAHDLWINVEKHTVDPGETLKIAPKIAPIHGDIFPRVTFTRPLDTLAEFFHLGPGGERRKVEGTPDRDGWLSLKLEEPGTHMIVAATKPVIWPEQPEAGQQRLRFERYAKALIHVSGARGGRAWSKPVGDRLEIVPMDDPTTAREGHILRLQVLFEGKPESGYSKSRGPGRG